MCSVFSICSTVQPFDLSPQDKNTVYSKDDVITKHGRRPAPEFTATAVVDGQFKEVKLSYYRGKYVVLFFYLLDFTFVCPTEIVAFSERAEEFRKSDCEVLAASTDSHFSHLAWINTEKKHGGLGPMKIPLLADPTQAISRDYGVLKEDEGIAYRSVTKLWDKGLFGIDDKGILKQIPINDLSVVCSVDETLHLVQAFQHTDKFGEVCPAGWRPGRDTIVPDSQKSKEFFSKQN
ncbi:peroxiredoxin-1-like [Salvelinus fontinalis]|uniref:peroxiredoxin-1-like n=1 Tax=Salvelinus fontinalis TaxID=8038 RepID=UPI002486C3C6|nr:peroxiredoxin-1-like [Salvelinus fontinalis]